MEPRKVCLAAALHVDRAEKITAVERGTVYLLKRAREHHLHDLGLLECSVMIVVLVVITNFL